MISHYKLVFPKRPHLEIPLLLPASSPQVTVFGVRVLMENTPNDNIKVTVNLGVNFHRLKILILELLQIFDFSCYSN